MYTHMSSCVRSNRQWRRVWKPRPFSEDPVCPDLIIIQVLLIIILIILIIQIIIIIMIIIIVITQIINELSCYVYV